jgi:hypothetical protein
VGKEFVSSNSSCLLFFSFLFLTVSLYAGAIPQYKPHTGNPKTNAAPNFELDTFFSSEPCTLVKMRKASKSGYTCYVKGQYYESQAHVPLLRRIELTKIEAEMWANSLVTSMRWYGTEVYDLSRTNSQEKTPFEKLAAQDEEKFGGDEEEDEEDSFDEEEDLMFGYEDEERRKRKRRSQKERGGKSGKKGRSTIDEIEQQLLESSVLREMNSQPKDREIVKEKVIKALAKEGKASRLRCLISDCQLPELLQLTFSAPHVYLPPGLSSSPSSASASSSSSSSASSSPSCSKTIDNLVLDNSLLLRADLHRLFCLGWLSIHPDTLRVAVSERLKGTTKYYKEFNGNLISGASSQGHPGISSNFRQFLGMHYHRIFEGTGELVPSLAVSVGATGANGGLTTGRVILSLTESL